MDVGIDTVRQRLDLITWDAFRLAHGATQGAGGALVGGEPSFAGRHFLGGDFLWGHGEATDCMANPNPEHPEQLKLLTAKIAPLQAAMPSRQQVAGLIGHAYGKVDADAVCRRLEACLQSGEFSLPPQVITHVWLVVDPAAPLSVDYWAGWSSYVNAYGMLLSPSPGPGVFQPFRAGILCRFMPAAGGKLRPDPQVQATVHQASATYRGQNATCYACWADAPDPAPNWSAFDGGPTPRIWRHSAGTAAWGPFAVDVANPGGTVPNAAETMLTVNAWQSNVPAIQRFGFITDQGNGLRATQIANFPANPIPSLTDLFGHYTLPSGPIRVVGRYLKPNVRDPQAPTVRFLLTRSEAQTLSNAHLEVFTIWEDINTTAGGQPTQINYFDPANHAGEDDGKRAFAYCGDTLSQPPHTPVFFTVDFDPVSTNTAVTAAREVWIKGYLTDVKAQRDAYTLKNPDRPFLIGLYGNGEVNRWAYEQGIVDAFWQSVGPGSSGNTMPGEFPYSDPVKHFRPWYHANRWQFNKESGLAAAPWNVVPGADPDVDWGDGGSWTLLNGAVRDLEDTRRLINSLQAGATFNLFGELVFPKGPGL